MRRLYGVGMLTRSKTFLLINYENTMNTGVVVLFC